MEDALAPKKWKTKSKRKCLNPCFNGRCTRTEWWTNNKVRQGEGLNPCFNGRCTRTVASAEVVASQYGVLILVLMEDALARGLIFHI